CGGNPCAARTLSHACSGTRWPRTVALKLPAPVPSTGQMGRSDQADRQHRAPRPAWRGRHWFLDLDDAREKIEEWRTEYSEVRPHSAIGDRTPLFLIHLPRQHVEASTSVTCLSRNSWSEIPGAGHRPIAVVFSVPGPATRNSDCFLSAKT